MQELRSAVYQNLAEALDEPPDWLALPGREWPLYQAARAVPCPSTAYSQAVERLETVAAETLEERRKRYARLFAEPGRNIAMYESGSMHGRLLTEETFAVDCCYKQAGLSIAGAEMPDHACLELSFLAFLSGNPIDDPCASEAAFLQEHAGRWLPAFGGMLAASKDPVYAPIGLLLSAWLEEASRSWTAAGSRPAPGSRTVSGNRTASGSRTASGRQAHTPAQSPARQPRASGRFPAVKESEGCTLCSFCASVCPAKALSIIENSEMTALALRIDRCTGCGKCTRVCPEGALCMAENDFAVPAFVDGKIILRQSPRAACKACGLPMISQAELAYLSACLEDPAWLAYCPGCRSRFLS